MRMIGMMLILIWVCYCCYLLQGFEDLLVFDELMDKYNEDLCMYLELLL